MNKLKIYTNFIAHQVRLRQRFILGFIAFWLLMSILFAAIYPILRENTESLGDLIGALEGTGLAESFNISQDYASSLPTFIGGEFLTFWALTMAIAAFVIGANSLGGAIANKKILVYLSKPLSRSEIYFLSSISGLVSILIIMIGVVFGLLISLEIFIENESLSTEFVSIMSLGILLFSLCFFALGKLLGLVMRPSQAFTLGAGIAIFGQILAGLATINDYLLYTNYANPYYYLDFEALTDAVLQPEQLAILAALAVYFGILGLIIFRRKQIYV